MARYVPGMRFEEGTAHVAWLGFGLVADVRRGENAGRTLHHDFVVLEACGRKTFAGHRGRLESGP